MLNKRLLLAGMTSLKDVKKMCSFFRTGNSSSLVGYSPPTLHKGVRWFVDFTAWDPAISAMRRKRYYVSGSLSITQKKVRANEILQVLTRQLAQGWNPWVNDDDSRGHVIFENCLQRYYTLIRPGELSNLKIGDISLKNRQSLSQRSSARTTVTRRSV